LRRICQPSDRIITDEFPHPVHTGVSVCNAAVEGGAAPGCSAAQQQRLQLAVASMMTGQRAPGAAWHRQARCLPHTLSRPRILAKDGQPSWGSSAAMIQPAPRRLLCGAFAVLLGASMCCSPTDVRSQWPPRHALGMGACSVVGGTFGGRLEPARCHDDGCLTASANASPRWQCVARAPARACAICPAWSPSSRKRHSWLRRVPSEFERAAIQTRFKT